MRDYRKSGGTLGLGPAYRLGHSSVRVPAVAVDTWLAGKIEKGPANDRV